MSEMGVKGLADLQKFLDHVPVKMEKNIMRGALRAGANVLKEKAKENCPIGQPSEENRKKYGGYEGALRDSIRVTTNIKGGTVYAHIKAGGKTKNGADVYYAHMIEYTGAVAHSIFGTKGHPLNVKGKLMWMINHPGMVPKPYLRPALDEQAQNAVLAAAKYIKKRLATKAGLDTSHIEIEAA